MKIPWYQRSRRRMFLDFHIAEWDDSFLASFDPEEMAEHVRLANATAMTVFANTHTGLCNYPTRVGKMHAQWEKLKRDMLGEMIRALHKRGIDVVIYYCLIYTDWYWDQHPECRVVDGRGISEKEWMGSWGHPHRFSLLCPNNRQYREYALAQIREICEGYDFEGVWPDMTWWPTVCYCPSCQERYRLETGFEIPRLIHWSDPDWVRFQRKRQEWLAEFVELVTTAFKQGKPGVSVAHQSGTFSADWMYAPSVELARKMDWLSADLYGERYGLSFWAKLFRSQSNLLPFEHVNAWVWPNIHEHMVPRSVEQMRVNVFSALANDGAMVFIDPVDPSGAIHKPRYHEIGSVFREMEPYEPHAGGIPCQDIAIYYSFENGYDVAENHKRTDGGEYSCGPKHWPGHFTHRGSSMNAAKILTWAHLPFGVITKKNLADLSRYQLILLSNVTVMDEDEVAAFRAYVTEGGCLYASKDTSLLGWDGTCRNDFQLADLCGVTRRGELRFDQSYVRPEPEYEALFDPFTGQWPATLTGDTPILVDPLPGAQVVARIVEPFTDPRGQRYAAILTNPPGRVLDHPALVMNRFGSGRVLYSAGAIECWDHPRLWGVLARLWRSLLARLPVFETDGHPATEVLLYHQPERKRYTVNVLNVQQELPNIPVQDMHIHVRVDGASVCAVRLLPGGEELDFSIEGVYVCFTLPRLEYFAMVSVEYR